MKRILTVIAFCGSLTAASAAQNELVPPTSGQYSGVEYSQKLGDAFRSLAGCNKGSNAPANVGGSVVDGQCWIDDSGTPWIKKRYVNGGWAVEGALDPTDSSYAGVIGGGIASVASATTTDLGSVPQANVTITGTTTIAGFGSSAPPGVVKIVRFASALTLTDSSALKLPTGGYDLVTADKDRAIVTHLGAGDWEITQYTRASGVPIDITAVGEPKFIFAASVPTLHVQGDGRALTRTSYPAYTAKVTRAQNGTRTSGNATIASVADTSGMGAGMPVEGTGINAGCTIASVVANTSITLNSSSCVTASGTSTVTVFLTGYGAGGSSTTVGVPDCRGRTLAGRDHSTPGSLSGRLTSSYFGSDSAVMAATGTALESKTLSIGQMPSHSHTGSGSTSTDGSHSHPYNDIYDGGSSLGAADTSTFNSTGQIGHSSTTSAAGSHNHSYSFTTSTSGSGDPFSTVQPTLIAECVVRVTP